MGENACDDIFAWAVRDPDRAMFAVRADGRWQPVTVGTFAARATSVAAGLIAAGIRPGDRVGLMSAPSLDWVICDFAIWVAGAVTVPVYETSSIEQVRWELTDSGVVAVFAGTAQIAALIHAAQAAKVEVVWELDAGGLDVLANAGQGVPAGETERRRNAVTAQTLATIVYTSGATGRPKGCMISHGNLTRAVRAILSVPGVQDRMLAGDASSLFFLPLSHILARVVVLCLVHGGKCSGFLSDPSDLPAEPWTSGQRSSSRSLACWRKWQPQPGSRPRPKGTSGCSPRPKQRRSHTAGPVDGQASGCGCGTPHAGQSTHGCGRRWAGKWPG